VQLWLHEVRDDLDGATHILFLYRRMLAVLHGHPRNSALEPIFRGVLHRSVGERHRPDRTDNIRTASNRRSSTRKSG
jgi:hypothetical protein